MKRLLILTALALLSGCKTYPVQGSAEDGTKFLGTATSYMGGSGSMDMTADNGAICTGEYGFRQGFMTDVATGNGTFKCSDGLSGTFAFSGSAHAGGRGFGKTADGRKISFYFGDVDIIINDK